MPNRIDPRSLDVRPAPDPVPFRVRLRGGTASASPASVAPPAAAQGGRAPGLPPAPAASRPAAAPVESKNIDTIAAALSEVAAQADECGPVLAPLVSSCCAWLADASALRFKASDMLYAGLESQAPVIADAATAVAAAAPRGQMDGRTWQGAQNTAALTFRLQAVQRLRSAVGEELKDESGKIANECVLALDALRVKIDFLASRYALLPASFTADGVAIEELIKQEQRRVDVAVMNPSAIAKLWQSAIAADELETARQIEVASESYLHEVARGGAQLFIAKRPNVQMRDGLPGQEVLEAIKLLHRFAAARLERLPPEITLARTLYDDRLVPLFRAIIGVQARTLTTEQIFEVAGRGGLGLSIDPSWAIRDLGPIDDAVSQWPPGWQPRGADAYPFRRARIRRGRPAWGPALGVPPAWARLVVRPAGRDRRQ